MAKTKKELTDYEKVMKCFNDDFNDLELQERFNNFEKSLANLKERYNEHVPEVNAKINMAKDLDQMILDSAKMGFLNNDAITKAKEVQAYLDGIIPHMENLKSSMEEEKRLIEKYKEGSNQKLFHYWKIFKEIDKETAPWMEWKRDYDKRIF